MLNNIRTAQKAQLGKHSSEGTATAQKRFTWVLKERTYYYLQFSWFVLSAILLVCEWNENTKLNLRITALVSQWAAWRQVLVDMHLWAAVTLFFWLPQSAQQTCYYLLWPSFLHPLPAGIPSLILLSLALLPLISLFSPLSYAAWSSVSFSFSADPSLLCRGLLSLMPADSSALHLSFPESFSTKTSCCLLIEPVAFLWGGNAGTCHPPTVTAGQSEHSWGLSSPAPPGTNTNAQLTQIVMSQGWNVFTMQIFFNIDKQFFWWYQDSAWGQ